MLKRSVYVSIFLVAVVLGLLLAVQFRVSNDYVYGIPRERTQEMVADLRQLTNDNENLQTEIQDIQLKLKQVNEGQYQAMLALQSEIDKGLMAAGMVTVEGPGIEVILNNPSPGGADNDYSAELFLIRDEDILKLVNELRASGAEAISLNGQRVIATSEIRFAGSFINVNTTRVVPPYQILAIGDPDELERNLMLSGGLKDYLSNFGIQVKVETNEKLTVPAFSGDLNYKYVGQS